MLSVQEKEFFFKNGYLIERKVFKGDELKRLRECAYTVKNKVHRSFPAGVRHWPEGLRKNFYTEMIPEERALYTWGVNEITRPELLELPLIDSLAHYRVDEILTGLLEMPRAWGLKLLWAPKKSHYNLHWHRDIDNKYDSICAYKPLGNDHVQYNAALEYDNSFIVVPGSHRRALTPEENAAVAADKTGEVSGQLRTELEPGDIVFMDAHALHRGEAQPGAPRLSLHFSAQAQWVPLKIWGEKDHWDWICSEAFKTRLNPRTRPYYDRLSTAPNASSSLQWLEIHASCHGWTPQASTVFMRKEDEAQKPAGALTY